MEGRDPEDGGDKQVETPKSEPPVVRVVEGDASTRDWSDLTPVCLTNIFRRLGLDDRWKAAMPTCKSWLEAAQDPSLFYSFDLEPFFKAMGGVRSDCAQWWTPEFESRVDSMVRAAADWGGDYLREIRVQHCSDRALMFVAERCPNLEILAVRSSMNVSNVSLKKIASNCHLLRELDVSNCYEVTHESLEEVGTKCSGLTVLKRNHLNWLDPSQHTGIVPSDYLDACPQEGDSEAAAIARSMPNLRHLELRFSKVSVSGLLSLSQGCLHLESLDVVGCANLTGRAIDQATANMKSLKQIKKPNLYIPRTVVHVERYGHWRLYDERFQTNVFNI